MSNIELIANAAREKGIHYTGNNLKTFAEWKKENKTVKKGEKAILTVQLWNHKTYEYKETKEEKSKFIKPMTYLFAEWQVIPITAH